MNGDHSLYFQKQGLEVRAIDVSHNMVDLAKQKGIDAQVMDMRNMNFPDSSFDGIWAVASLLHVPKKEAPAVVYSFDKLLDKNGVIYAVVMEGEGERVVVSEKKSDIKRFFAFWSEQEFKDLLGKHFEQINFEKRKPRASTYLHYIGRKKST